MQRLSAEVSGKAQKYSRIGAREFVSYEYEEFTVENIRRACEKHFAVDKLMSCDILAGEQGPSCNTINQIPDSRVIHVRFVELVGEGTELGIREDYVHFVPWSLRSNHFVPSKSHFVPPNSHFVPKNSHFVPKVN